MWNPSLRSSIKYVSIEGDRRGQTKWGSAHGGLIKCVSLHFCCCGSVCLGLQCDINWGCFAENQKKNQTPLALISKQIMKYRLTMQIRRDTTEERQARNISKNSPNNPRPNRPQELLLLMCNFSLPRAGHLLCENVHYNIEVENLFRLPNMRTVWYGNNSLTLRESTF